MKVLIVDDSIVFQTFFKKTLKEMPEISYVQSVSNGKQCLLQLKLTEFDLIILDLEMPVMNGFETLVEINKLNFKGKVIVCSGLVRVDFDAIQRVLNIGADGIISKTYQKNVSSELSAEAFRNELVPRILSIYNNKYKETKEEIIRHSYDKECIDGVLIIHLLKNNEPFMTYDYGTMNDGIKQIVHVIREANKSSTPLFIDESVNNYASYDEIQEALNETKPENLYSLKGLDKEDLSLDWVHPNMKRFIQEKKVVNLLVTGFNRTCCVKNASQQIHNTYGVNIIICDELLFGHNNVNIRPKGDVQEIKDMFEAKYIVHEDVKEVIAGLWKNAPLKRAREEKGPIVV